MKPAPRPGDRILVVDDDRDLANTLVEYLGRLGYHAAAAYGGREGLALLEQEEFALVVAGLKMSQMSGDALLEAVKARDAQTVVIFTGHGTIDKAAAAIKKGAYDVIAKPIDFKALEIVIKRALYKYGDNKKLHRLRKQLFILVLAIPLILLLGFVFGHLF